MFFNLTPVVKNLIILNVGVFLIQMVGGDMITYWIALHPVGSEGYFPTQLFTNVFAHGGFYHLLWNMLMLFFFGPLLEQMIGDKKITLLYITAAMVATGLHVAIIQYYFGYNTLLMGASGAINGVVVATAILNPNREVYLYFAIPVKFKYIVLFWVGKDLMSALNGTPDGIAHFAHLGGAIAGAVLIMLWKKDISRY